MICIQATMLRSLQVAAPAEPANLYVGIHIGSLINSFWCIFVFRHYLQPAQRHQKREIETKQRDNDYLQNKGVNATTVTTAC